MKDGGTIAEHVILNHVILTNGKNLIPAIQILCCTTNDKSCNALVIWHSGLLRKLAMTVSAASSLRACEAIQVHVGNYCCVTSLDYKSIVIFACLKHVLGYQHDENPSRHAELVSVSLIYQEIANPVRNDERVKSIFFRSLLPDDDLPKVSEGYEGFLKGGIR